MLPKGYTKTRRYGDWSNTRRKVYLQHCRILLSATTAESAAVVTRPDAIADAICEEDAASPLECRRCPCCGAMILQRAITKPNWREVMASAARPAWYGLPLSPKILPATFARR